MRKLLSIAALFGGAALLSPGLTADDTKATGAGKGEMMLEGGYTIVSGESDGKPIPAARIKGTTTRFTKDRIVTTDKDKKEVYVATYTLDDSKKPCVITMKSVVPKGDVEAKGLIKKEGDTVMLIYALPGGKMPDDFKTEDKQNMFVLKNLNKGEKGAKSADRSDR
ncbi:MAG: TIGR03067 domain-containing protein [Gemmataceae bacterium]|nr:TIGR03067 domain-containing protein [Gemmataceae bacterium]